MFGFEIGRRQLQLQQLQRRRLTLGLLAILYLLFKVPYLSYLFLSRLNKRKHPHISFPFLEMEKYFYTNVLVVAGIRITIVISFRLLLN